MKRASMMTLLAAALVLGAVGRVAGAQASVVGVVRDSGGSPIHMAQVTLSGRTVMTDSMGRFFVSHSPADTLALTVRRMGYESVSFNLSAREAADNTVDVVLRRLATTLDVVNITDLSERNRTALRGFDERMQTGLGTFVTREEIRKRNTSYLTDVLRQKRGVSIVSTRTGRVLRFASQRARRCMPLIWLDGQAAPGLEIDQVHPNDVEGIELYPSLATTPGEFHRSSTTDCGTVVIWTTRPRLHVAPKPPG